MKVCATRARGLHWGGGFLAFVLCQAAPGQAREACVPKLEASLHPQAVIQGTNSTLLLRLTGCGLEEVQGQIRSSLQAQVFELGRKRGFLDSGDAPTAGPGFVHEAELTPHKAGSFTLGPFQIRYGRRTLSSNPVQLEVKAPTPGAISLTADKTRVKVGEAFSLQLRAEMALGDCGLREDKGLEVKNKSTSQTVQVVAGETRHTVVHNYSLAAERSGTYVIDAGFFEALPAGFQVDPVTVEAY